MNRSFILFLLLSILLFSNCGNPTEVPSAKQPVEKAPESQSKELSISVTNFDDSNYSLFKLTNANGIELTATNYGGIITSLKTPDKNGELADIVLGFDNYAAYEKEHPYFGAIIGRYANRIAGGQFSIDGKKYVLDKNDGENSLHGGKKGYDKRSWVFRTSKDEHQVEVSFYRLSPDGEEGFPGELKPNITYTLDNENNLTIKYTAITDKPTVVNLTNHSYFNLKGEGNGDILDHELMIVAEKYTPVNKNLIPTGIKSVKNTPFDFSTPKTVGAGINAKNQQLELGNGYDHNFVLDNADSQISRAALVYEPTSGRYVEVLTDQPGIQFYTGNLLDGTLTGKSGKPYVKRGGFCLETQHFPDSPNQPAFPSTVLRPGEKFKSTTVFHFGAAETNPAKR